MEAEGLAKHRVRATGEASVVDGEVKWSAVKSIWFLGMASTALVGGWLLFSWAAFALFVASTAIVLLFGHSLGSHRKLIHDSYQCPRWLERTLVYLGVQVGLAGPIGLLRQHDLRDYAQRLSDCHPYLRHGSGPSRDAWWQLNCDLQLARPPDIRIESRVADDAFYRFLERTWMWQQLPVALLFHAWGGWAFVVFGVCARVTAGVFGHWLIGYFAHKKGGMHHEVRGAAVQGRNIGWTSLLTMGESWHNNHHAFPGSARLGLYQGEWDPGWWMLQALQRMGLVWDLRLPEDLAPRPELLRLNAPRRRSALLQLLDVLCARQARAGIEIVWPGRWIDAGGLRRMLGPAPRLRLEPASPRLLVRAGEEVLLVGMPALCAAIGRQRGAFLRGLMVMLAPLAVAMEGVRSRGSPATC